MTSNADLHYPRWNDEDVSRARELAGSWRRTAEGAFATAAQQPEVYQRTTLLVGVLTRRLREVGQGPTALLEAWASRQTLLAEVLDSHERLSGPGIDHDGAVSAAFAMRYTEVAEEIASARRLHALATADVTGGWVVLEQTGPSAGDPFVPYRRVEAEPATGRALLVTTRPDETLARCVHEVAQGWFDRTTGALRWDEETLDGAVTAHHDETSREAAVVALKQPRP